MKVDVTYEEYKDLIKYRIKNNIYVNENGCWIWKHPSHPYGYGKLYFKENGKGSDIGSHRVSWIVYKGEVPKEMRVCHNCPNGDNPACCNPDHLFLGTAKDNTRDMIKKGRDPFNYVGVNNNKATLNDEIVLEMRNMRKNGFKVVDIAKKFNVKYFTCLDAVSGRNWKHI